MSTSTSRPSSIAIDNASDETLYAPTSLIAAMIDLSPTYLNENVDDCNVASASKLIPMTDSASGERPLPSLHSPLMYRDVAFAAIFMVHLILMLVATGSIRADGNPRQEQENERKDIVGELQNLRDKDSSLDDADVGVVLRSLGIVNMLFALGWLLLFRFSSKLRFVQGSCIFSITGLVALAIMLFLFDSHDGIIWGIICSGVVVLELVWYVRSNPSLDFVAVFFELVADFLVTHSALGYATIATLIAYTMWAGWICTTIGYVGRDVSPWSLSMMYLIFHFYWMSNVFKNIITIVASGTTIIWYYHNESTEISPVVRENVADHDSLSNNTTGQTQDQNGEHLDRKAVLHYVCCALSSSFGSICIGSLLCPLAHLVWNALRWARRDESLLSQRFISLRSERVEHFIRTYHKYSFVHIAGYNKPYYVAAHDAWKLIEHHGVEAIVDDDLTSRILLLGGNGWAGIMSAVTASALSGASSHAIFLTLASFTLCYTTISLATQVIAAVIKTLFVCFAENPERLSQLHPLIYHRFVRLAELKSFRDHKAPASTRA
ncbi:unnamed protein product [Peronospora destructor]|uniref:Choline transporter-like protein n=1 Tax=Peronospora destructor TaxID=86335 RepID=A0AAV0VA37_9STRA|nr:unnamed protein product [Peronospora destructor]